MLVINCVLVLVLLVFMYQGLMRPQWLPVGVTVMVLFILGWAGIILGLTTLARALCW
jgi:hypothetical protein